MENNLSKIDNINFKAAKWHSEIVNLRYIHSLLLESQQAFIVSKNRDEASDRSAILGIQKATQLYNQQMIVLVVTYIELILRDFLIALFNKFPERMYNFLEIGEGKTGFVNLKEILKADSLPALLNSLSEQADSSVMKGRFKAELSNLEKIIGNEGFPDDVKSQLIHIVEMRNRIVHETITSKVNDSDVSTTLNSCLSLIEFLSKIAYNSSILLDINNLDDVSY